MGRTALHTLMPGSGRVAAFGVCLLLLSPTGPAMAVNDAARDEVRVAAAMADVSRASRAREVDAAADRLLSGELSYTHPSGFGAMPDADRIVMVGDAEAIARVPAHGDWPDLYFFLNLDAAGVWRPTAVRALAMPPFIRMLHDALRAQASLESDEAFMLANVELAMRPDVALRDWFVAHRTILDRIAVLARASAPPAPAERPLVAPQVAAELRRLHLLGGSIKGDGTLRIVIGGVQDDSVGLLHLPEGRAPPPMSRQDFIWIEPLAGGWYLFRTT
ncbi:MAG TPA: hypothetical protein VF552_03230 [Allosphingosinicella sp.]|jgi:hypothetical protein